MYKNAGRSIKNIVKTVVSIEMAIFIILGIVLMAVIADVIGFILGAVVAGFGCFIAWLNGLELYAYGDIADNIKMIANIANAVYLNREDNMEENDYTKIVRMNIDANTATKFQRNMINEYRAQLENGVLTPEQYRNKVEEILKEDK